MNKFNPDSKCLKCGRGIINICYCDKQQETVSFTELCYQQEIKVEHLHKTCERCSFEGLGICQRYRPQKINLNNKALK